MVKPVYVAPNGVDPSVREALEQILTPDQPRAKTINIESARAFRRAIWEQAAREAAEFRLQRIEDATDPRTAYAELVAREAFLGRVLRRRTPRSISHLGDIRYALFETCNAFHAYANARGR